MLASCSVWAALGLKWLAMQAFTVIGVPPCPGGRTWERGLLIADRGSKGQGSLRPLAGLGLAAHCALGLACLAYPPPWGIVFDWLRPLACGNWLVGLARAPLSLSPLLRRSYLVARDRVWRLLSFQWPALAMVGPWAQQGFVPAVGPGLLRSPGPLLRSPPASPGIGCPVASSMGAMRR